MTPPFSRVFGLGRAARLTLVLVVLAFWWAACWHATDIYFERHTDEAYREAVAKADQYVAATAQGFNRIVSTRRGIPEHLARDPEIRRAFARIGPAAPGEDLPYEERKRRWSADPALAKLNQRLALDAENLGLSTLQLVDEQLNCFAASNGNTAKSYVGVSYAGRDYTSSGPSGQSDYRVTIGKKSGTSAIAFFAPVFDNGRKLGVVATRLELTSFLNWLAPADAFLTDRNGVVVLASDIGLLGSATASAPAHRMHAAARRAAYREEAIDTLDIAPAGDTRYPELRRVPGRIHPVIHRSQGVEAGIEPTIHVFWPFPQRAEFALQRDVVASGGGAGGTALLLFALAVAARRREQRKYLVDLSWREQEFRSLAESSPDYIVRYDLEGKYRYLNTKLVRFLGLDNSEAVNGKRPEEVWADNRYSAIQRAAAQAVESGETQNVEIDVPAEDRAAIRNHHIVVVPERDNDGKIVGTLAFGRDITARKSAEAALQRANAQLTATLETIPDLLFEVDREGRYLDIRAPDPALLAAPKEALLGRTLAEMLPPEAAHSSMTAIAEADRYGKSYGNLIRLDLPDGARWFEVSAAKKPAGEDTPATFIVLSRDVTARMTALAEAQRLARLRGEFLAHMSHELRTPLNGILGHVQLLQAEPGTSARNTAALDAIRAGGAKLQGMIDDILDLTCIEAGTLELHAEDVALAHCVREVADIAATQTRMKGLRLACTLSTDLPASVHTDPTRLSQVLTRLLANAIKFTEQGDVELRIERTENCVRFTVRDSGPGLTSEEIERLFRPFEPIGAAKNRPSGAGLGLALARRLVQLLGGKLQIESQPGAGSRFRFDLPLIEASGSAALPAAPSAVPPPPTFELAEHTPLAVDEIPPPDALRALHAIALLGNMRDIRREAERIAALAPAYRRVAAHIDAMAANFQSKALLAIIEGYLSATDTDTATDST